MDKQAFTHKPDCPKADVPLDRPCFYCSGKQDHLPLTRPWDLDTVLA